MKEKIVGRNKTVDQPGVIMDQITKIYLFKPTEIVEGSDNYRQQLLTNDEPKEEYKEDLRIKRMVHEVRMEEIIHNDNNLTPVMYNETLKKLKEKGGRKYHFILKAGKSLHSALYKLYEVVWNGEREPESWRDTKEKLQIRQNYQAKEISIQNYKYRKFLDTW